MPRKSIFKTDFYESSGPKDPETLFHDLRGRSPEIKHLWSHQADLLREYYKNCVDVPDVAIELPTGSGKTLVGLLIGEWRRQKLRERVAYLCPTRQLAFQVGEQAKKYGINAHVFVGKQTEYPTKEFSEYKSSRAIAITTYSAIFNINPRIDDAQTLILDDAHAGENYIASMWSVEILRSSSAYQPLINLLRNELDPGFYAEIISDSEGDPARSRLVELLPGVSMRKYIYAIRDILNEHLEEESPPWYAWQLIKDHVVACNFFISWDSILIRPFIPPTQTHLPFKQAKQRIYMSATLGAGGELERVTGVKSIKRLPVPAGWDKRGSGRRLFLLPDIALSTKESIQVIQQAVNAFDRSLILVPSQYEPECSELIKVVKKSIPHILQVQDIEDSIEPFLSAKKTLLLLSRYDGLDLPDEACRLLIIAGLPTGTNLQEKFLWLRLGATSVLRDRVITRFTQGVGRCTRSDNDYAVVFVTGRRFIDFLLKIENRRLLHPELQIELEFGIKQSEDKEVEEFEALWRAFIEQGEEWQDAEKAILSMRDKYSRSDDPVSEKLSSIVANEVEYVYSLWREDFESALEHARKVSDTLDGDETKAYRAWWYYLSAEAAMLLYETTGDVIYQSTAQDFFKRASKCCIGVSWFARMGRSESSNTDSSEIDELTAKAVETIRDRLAEWGAVGKRFEKHISRVGENLQSTDHKAFHRGLKGLGEMLGFDVELPEGDGAPDCVWSIGSLVYVVHEAKSEHTPSHPIGVNDIRQAQSHENWVQENKACEANTRILCVIESPRTTVAHEAVAHGRSLYHVTPLELETLFNETAAALRRVRAKLTKLSDEKVLEELFREFNSSGLIPLKVIERLSQRPVASMKQKD